MTEPEAVGVDARNEVVREKHIVSSEKIEETEVYLGGTRPVGSIQSLMIDKESGKIVYAIIQISSGTHQEAVERAVPWRALQFDTNAQAYDINVTDEQLRAGPVYPETTNDPTFDPAWEEHVHSYFNSEPYWNSETDRATDMPFGKKKS